MSKKALLSGFIALGLSVVAVGCASVPRGSDRLLHEAQRFEPPPGKANLYVIRPYHFVGAAALWTVILDSEEFGILGVRSYLYGAIDPGEHSLRAIAQGASPDPVKFTCEAGRNYFFRVAPGWFAVEITPLEEQDSRARLRECTLSGFNRFELPLGGSSPLR